MKKRIVILSLLLSIALAAAGLAEHGAAEPSGADLISAGFYPVSEVMAEAGYVQTGEHTYETRLSDAVTIQIAIDPDGLTCLKNQYAFQLTKDQLRRSGGALYLSRGALEAILACQVEYGNAGAALTPHSYAPGEWTRLSRLIAHAGGAVRRASYYAVSTNSLEALVESYSLGHRVFEFDFQLTSDGALAVVHDWKNHGMSNDEAMSAKAWKASKEAGNPASEGRFTTLLVEDLLDQMLVNPDMFVVTDTKSKRISEEDVVREFELIRDAALARDPALLDRIVPQVYDPATYDLTTSVYPWRSIIYTTYQNHLFAEEIIQFAAEKDDIHVITASYKDERFTEADIRQAHEAGLLFFTHTLNTYKSITEERGRGVDGLYTDLLIPEDWVAYDRVAASAEAGTDAPEAVVEIPEAGDGPAEDDAPDTPDAEADPEEDGSALYYLDLSEISESFEGFLKYAAGLKDCVILLAVRGEAIQGLSSEALDMLSKLRIKADLSIADGCSFLAVIKPDSVSERAGYEEVKRSGKLPDDVKYSVRSAGEFCGDSCSIKIDGKEYAPNERGFNVVVYSTALHEVVHSGAYDTHVAD